MNKKIEALLWSIAFPGFGQFLNGKVIKGIVLMLMELIINIQSNFNELIFYSFQGDIEKAIEQADYQWLLFYPCIYFFAIWDAWKDAGGGEKRYSFLPIVFAAFFVTVGCIYSSSFRIFGVILGPVWLPILFVIPGLVVGKVLEVLIEKSNNQS